MEKMHDQEPDLAKKLVAFPSETWGGMTPLDVAMRCYAKNYRNLYM